MTMSHIDGQALTGDEAYWAHDDSDQGDCSEVYAERSIALWRDELSVFFPVHSCLEVIVKQYVLVLLTSFDFEECEVREVSSMREASPSVSQL